MTIEIKEWTYLDRSKWSAIKEMDGEPDKAQWPDTATDLPCLAVRHPQFGHWCGYVGVPKSHPLFGVSYIDAESVARPGGEEWDERDWPDALALNVHGGLTFSDACQPDPRGEEWGICHTAPPGEEVWWFGFDCSHCDDVSPGLTPLAAPFPGARYRTIDYVAEQCAKLAKQLRARGQP